MQKTSGEKPDHPASEAGAEPARKTQCDCRGREGPHVTGPQRPKKTLVFNLRAMRRPTAEVTQTKDQMYIFKNSSGCCENGSE